MIPQRGICHFIRSENELLGIREDDKVFQGFSVAFDMSFEEIWISYLAGATPNCPWFEYPVDPPAWTVETRDFMLREPYAISPDGTIAVPDQPGLGAKMTQALAQAGIKLVGFDDSPASRLFTPPLTTVRAPIEQAGRRAAVLLGQLIRGEDIELKVLLPTELVVRRSCGCSG